MLGESYLLLHCVAVCCSVLQCVVVCCSVLQCGAECCSALQCVAMCCNVLQCVAAHLDGGGSLKSWASSSLSSWEFDA